LKATAAASAQASKFFFHKVIPGIKLSHYAIYNDIVVLLPQGETPFATKLIIIIIIIIRFILIYFVKYEAFR
jgi:hypothetical protein